jgi:hypothetical protein
MDLFQELKEINISSQKTKQKQKRKKDTNKHKKKPAYNFDVLSDAARHILYNIYKSPKRTQKHPQRKKKRFKNKCLLNV